MRREFFIHFAFFFSFFVLTSLFNDFLSFSYWPFWIGGLIGTILPDVDHLLYVFFLNPQDLTSQRVNFLLGRKEVTRTISLLYETRMDRNNLVFHTLIFQLIFLVFTIFIITSSSSLLVKGISLAVLLHLGVDQLADIFELGSLKNWGRLWIKEMDHKASALYVSISFFTLFIAGLFV